MTTAVDCSEDNRLIIDGIKYVMLQREGEFYLETSCEEEEKRKVSASWTMFCRKYSSPEN